MQYCYLKLGYRYIRFTTVISLKQLGNLIWVDRLSDMRWTTNAIGDVQRTGSFPNMDLTSSYDHQPSGDPNPPKRFRFRKEFYHHPPENAAEMWGEKRLALTMCVQRFAKIQHHSMKHGITTYHQTNKQRLLVHIFHDFVSVYEKRVC